jgi:hypothetical protein
MFDTDLIFQARWDQLYDYFVSGYPPLVLQLLAINTVFLVFFAIRRATAKHKLRSNTAYAVQGLLIASNALVMFNNDILGFASSTRAMWHI